MKKRCYTLDEFIKFCTSKNITSFSAKDFGYGVAVSSPAVFEKFESNEDDDMLFAYIKLFHTGKNNNGSCVTEDAARKSLSGLAYRPVLANFTDINGEDDFTYHDFEIIKNDDGEDEIVYHEHQVGSITADEPTITWDDVRKHNYVYAKVAIPREYTKAAEIIERKGGTKCSVEMAINEMSYNAKEKYLELSDINILGVTLLGVDPDTGKEIKEGMEDANVSLLDFSAEKTINSYKVGEFNNNSLQNINYSEERGKNLDKLKALLAKYNKDINDVVAKFDKTEDEVITMFDSMSEDEINAMLSEMFEESSASDGDNTPVEDGDASNGDGTSAVANDDKTVDGNPTEPTVEDSTIKFSVTMQDGAIKTFGLTLNEIQNALNTLVNETYTEDAVWYCTDVFADDNYLVMYDWDGNAYKQEFARNEDKFELTGDRVPVKRVWVTDEEEAALNNMKNDYATLKNTVIAYQKKEDDDRKNSLINNPEYSSIFSNKDYLEMVSNKEVFEAMTSDEVAKKLDEILCDEQKKHNVSCYSATETTKTSTKKIFGVEEKTKPNFRYGNIFNK